MKNPFSRAVRFKNDLPILPGAFPVFGHLPAVYTGYHELEQQLRELGPAVWIQAGFGVWLLLCSGPDALDIFKSKAFTSTHLQEIAPIVAGHSVLAQDGAAHRHMRSALNPPFLPRGLNAGTMGKMSAQVFAQLADTWVQKGKVKVLPQIQSAALEIIFRMLGVPISDLEPWRQKYRDLLLANLNIKLRFPGSPAVKSEKAQVWLNERFAELVAEARAKPDPQTLLTALAHAKDEDGQPLTQPELLDNLRLLVLGGHETISSTMAWMAIHLAHEPQLWDQLTAEVSGKPTIPTSPDEAKSYPFAEALFRETVRFHPAFGNITRKSVAPFSLNDKPIPEGSLVSVNLWSISHDERVFPDPMNFTPTRWLGRSSAPSPIEISQFGAGPHFCLGYHLAWLEGVQFAVALALIGLQKNVRPHLPNLKALRPIYLPTEHPSPSAMVEFR